MLILKKTHYPVGKEHSNWKPPNTLESLLVFYPPSLFVIFLLFTPRILKHLTFSVNFVIEFTTYSHKDEFTSGWNIYCVKLDDPVPSDLWPI